MKTLALLLLVFAPLHASILFLNSTPFGADVSELPEGKKTKARSLGKTPIKLEYTNKVRVIISKSGYASVTNTYTAGPDILDERVLLAPLAFTVNFPVDSGVVLVNGRNYSSLDGNIILPFGVYDARFDGRKDLFALNAKSPYTPYVGLFTTTLIVSLGLTLGGAIAAPYYREQFNNATDFNQAVNHLSMSTAMNNMMWTGVGIGTGSLIGLGIFSYYEARERRIIKRFNARNLSYDVANDLKTFNNILSDPQAGETALNGFIRTYKTEGSPYLPEVYLRRARLYLGEGRTNDASKDLKTILSEYPAIEVYETAGKLLGDLYMEHQEYEKAYLVYKDSLVSALSYQDLFKKMIYALSRLAERSEKYRDLLRSEAEKGIKDKRVLDKEFLKLYVK